MSEKLKILFISAEVAPYAKRGGLGDVGGSLPKALKAMGHDVRIVMPAYSNIEAGYPGVSPMPMVLNVPIRAGTSPAGVFHGTLPGSEVPVYFIAEHNLFNRPEVYGYDDDAYRFAFFSRAALDLTVALHWRPDLVHAHDWHTAPAITWLATAGRHDPHFGRIPTIFTIHNLAHQGSVSWDIFDYLNIQTYSLNEEPYGQVNFMARGIHHATLLNTVSPTYAREITTAEGGSLHTLLQNRGIDLHGIINGLDYDVWNPTSDPRLANQFSLDQMEKRLDNRRALQRWVGLPQRDNVPLIGLISRLDAQKGLDILGHALHLLLNGFAGDAQFVVLGTGAPQFEQMFAQFAGYHRDKMAAILEYNAGMAPLIYGGSDMFLMPSRFEPCGLGQLIAMRYGSVPVVRATGGLVDTVQDGKTGFMFRDYSANALWEAIQRAIYVYNVDRSRWQAIQRNGMTADFSWQRSAQEYEQLYNWAIAREFSN
ncbi:MAG: glycogen synthase [Chloroflexota bacterium]